MSNHKRAKFASPTIQLRANDNEFLNTLVGLSSSILSQKNVCKEDIGNLAYLSIYCKDKQIRAEAEETMDKLVAIVKSGKMEPVD